MSSSNPLLEKYYEMFPEKKEKPKVIKADEFERTVAQVDEAFKKWSSNISVTSNLTSPSVATSTTSITKASAIKSYDKHSANDAFLEMVEKIKNGTAQVKCVSLQVDAIGGFSYGKKITFEVYDYEP
jgi:hypothetical protein